MKKVFLPLIFVLTGLSIGCSDEPKDSGVKGDDYIGVWMNPTGQKSQSANDVVINDRVIIDKTETKDVYAVSILARGVFTSMEFKPENGLLCAPNKACFQLVDGKLKLGGDNGVLTYEREPQNGNQ
ncbi:TPA: hypothetical protein OUI11_003402 [Acinetobacter baumannii]|nr:hypothetical protein [Acinetobacter baumannii]